MWTALICGVTQVRYEYSNSSVYFVYFCTSLLTGTCRATAVEYSIIVYYSRTLALYIGGPGCAVILLFCYFQPAEFVRFLAENAMRRFTIAATSDSFHTTLPKPLLRVRWHRGVACLSLSLLHLLFAWLAWKLYDNNPDSRAARTWKFDAGCNASEQQTKFLFYCCKESVGCGGAQDFLFKVLE